MEKIIDVLNAGRGILLKNNIDISEARLILSYVLNISKEELVRKDECTSEEFAKFLVLLEKRVNGTPYAYIVGHKEFMGLDFFVNENTLIPREDTETLVLEVLRENVKTILDIGTGSGCIAISLAKNIKNSVVTAVDISIDALNVAKRNAMKNEVNVEFLHSNLFENIKEKFDVIVSNPPYIKKEDIENLQKEVKKEPILALDGGATGLDFYRKIVDDAPSYLNPNGKLFFEIGYDEANDVKEMLEVNFKNIEIIKDLGGNDRVVKATLK